MYNRELINTIKDHCIEKKLTIAVAESVTAGHLQAAFSLADEASLFFQGGITVYNLGQKCRHLLVEPIQAAAANCVSAAISAQMAREVCALFASDFGIGVTGYAAPVPEKGINGLFAYFAIARRERLLKEEKIIAPVNSNSFDIQLFYTDQILKTLVSLTK